MRSENKSVMIPSSNYKIIDERIVNNTKLSSNHVRIQSSSQAVDNSITTAIAIEDASSAERDTCITNQTNLNLPQYKVINYDYNSSVSSHLFNLFLALFKMHYLF